MKKTLLTALSVFGAMNVQADDMMEYVIKENITTTNVNAKVLMKTKPDTFRTSIMFETEEFGADKAQKELNKLIKSATNTLKSQRQDYKLGHFNSYQDYKSKKHKASQVITIEGKDKEKIEAITTLLQEREGLVQSTTSFLSDEAKAKQFEVLFEKAYDDATKKAKFITKQLNGIKYSIVEMHHNMNTSHVRPMAYKAMAMAESVSDAPHIEIDNSEKDVWLNVTLKLAIHK
tara:strand:- start:1232 stop:1927 length:696 start_codon:yes stop_codon:yes gene_type:complete